MTSPSANQLNAPKPGVYQVDATASTIRFVTRAMFGLIPVRGTFGIARGRITVTEDATRSIVDVTVRADSFHTGNRKRDDHIRSADFLEAETHPEIVFHSDSAARSAGGATVSGTLTVQGVTRPAVLTVTLVSADGERLTATASAVVDRVDFGVTKATGMAGRKLTLNLDVVAVR